MLVRHGSSVAGVPWHVSQNEPDAGRLGHPSRNGNYLLASLLNGVLSESICTLLGMSRAALCVGGVAMMRSKLHSNNGVLRVNRRGAIARA